MVDGNYLLSNLFRESALNLKHNPSGYYVDSSSGANGLASFIFGKYHQVINTTLPTDDYDDVEEEEEEETVDDVTTPSPIISIVSYVPVFRLRYALNSSNQEMLTLGLKWEKELYSYLTQKYQSKLIKLSVSASTSIADTINKQAHHEGPYMTIMLLVFFIFVCLFISLQGNFQTSVGYLSLFGIISLALSTGATFGFISLIRIQIIEPMALIIAAIACKLNLV